MITAPHKGIRYTDFIARLVSERAARVYLELGVQSGHNISKVEVDTAYGVDPIFNFSADPSDGKRTLKLFRMTSDAFFKAHAAEVEQDGGLDFCFLDGMHLFEYLLRDFQNAEALSNRGGLITMHDCLPFDGEMIERTNNYGRRTPGPYAGAWTGDVWKIVPLLEKYRPDLSVILVDCEPTGLVCVSGLDPTSTVLSDHYLRIVADGLGMGNDLQALQDFYSERKIVRASDVVDEFRQSLYFKV